MGGDASWICHRGGFCRYLLIAVLLLANTFCQMQTECCITKMLQAIKRAFSRAISCGPAWVISQFTSQRDNCINWYKRDRGPPTGLPPCPKTLDIARNAGNFQQDISQNIDYFHPAAYMCFRTRRPTTNHHGES